MVDFLTRRKRSSLQDLYDWYLIERSEHSNSKWLQEEKSEHGINTGFWMYTGRISDACVEGSGADMLEIAKAIRDLGQFSAKRCAVTNIGERFLFHSPRNSQVRASVSWSAAHKLADQIYDTLTKS